MRSTTKWRQLVGCSQGALLVGLVSPTLFTAFSAKFASCVETSWLSFAYEIEIRMDVWMDGNGDEEEERHTHCG